MHGIAATVSRPTVPVWDRIVRVVHWGLALSVGACAITGFLGPRNALNLHLAASSMIAALLAVRVVWGRLGPGYARFRTWDTSAAALLAHLRDIGTGRRQGHLGHNPPGVAMATATLAVLLLLVMSGLVALGGAAKQGPLAFVMSFAVGSTAQRIHFWLACLLLALVAAHIGGVIFESWRLRENLAKAMWTGRKLARDEPAVQGEAQPRKAAAVLAAMALCVLPLSLGMSRLPGRGVPHGALNPVYARECGSCHMAYPPSLAPAPAWNAIMATLPDHFGEDASLPSATTALLADYLAANSAGHFDTRPANLLRAMDGADLRRITGTAAWQRLHHDLPQSIFRRRAVGTRAACAACHRDAVTARFDPQAIAVPQETGP